MPLPRAALPVLVGAWLSGIAVPTHAQSQGLIGPSATDQTAASDIDHSLPSKVEQAHFIFQGVVTKVGYRLSDPSPAGVPQLPYTFVTYRVEDRLKGETPVQSVTLRFLGGLCDNGKILQVEGTPFFDVGDQDIWFVRRNDESICPLLDCENGRFRLINNQVFNDLGQPQSLVPTGQLVSGKQVPLREVLFNQMGAHTLEYEISADREESPDESASSSAPERPALPTLDPTQFATHVRHQVQLLAQAGRLQKYPVVSVDIKAPLVAPLAKAVSPPLDAATSQPSVTERQEQDSDRWQQPPATSVQK